MKVIELRNTPIIIEWLQTANVKPNSEKSYLRGMQDFTEYTGKDPETLLEEAENDIRAGKLMRQRQLKRNLIGFRQSVKIGNAPKYGYVILAKMKNLTWYGVKSVKNLACSELARIQSLWLTVKKKLLTIAFILSLDASL